MYRLLVSNKKKKENCYILNLCIYNTVVNPTAGDVGVRNAIHGDRVRPRLSFRDEVWFEVGPRDVVRERCHRPAVIIHLD